MTRTRILVADTGPIIAYARVRQLDLLRQVVGELLIPTAIPMAGSPSFTTIMAPTP